MSLLPAPQRTPCSEGEQNMRPEPPVGVRRKVAGIRIPDSRLAVQAVEMVRTPATDRGVAQMGTRGSCGDQRCRFYEFSTRSPAVRAQSFARLGSATNSCRTAFPGLQRRECCRCCGCRSAGLHQARPSPPFYTSPLCHRNQAGP